MSHDPPDSPDFHDSPAVLMEQAIAQKTFSAGALLALQGGVPVWDSCHGRVSFAGEAQRVDESTCFDLASLTKVLSTTPLVLDLLSRGRLELNSLIVDLLPAFQGPAKEAVTVRMLLDHSAGLPDWRPFFERLRDTAPEAVGTHAGRDQILSWVAAEPLLARPGEESLYSDLGFLLLGLLVEKLTGQDLDQVFAERVAGRLHLKDLLYVALAKPGQARKAREHRVFAATEDCPWRGRVLVGEVHDDNCWAMGGVAGHAGLFGSAQAVASLAQAWLDSWRSPHGPFPQEWVRRFFSPSGPAGGNRALGFDLRSPTGSSTGSLLGPGAVGHLGFTGTSLWIDPQQELIVVLLTNRVHPSRQGEAIKAFRPRLHDALKSHLAKQ